MIHIKISGIKVKDSLPNENEWRTGEKEQCAREILTMSSQVRWPQRGKIVILPTWRQKNLKKYENIEN